MKKFLWSALAIMMVSALSIGFTSCGDDPDPDEVAVSTPMVSIGNSGGSQTIQIMSNTGWTISGAQPWLMVSPMQGSHNGAITITANENTDENSRTCTLFVQAGSASATIQVTQSPNTPHSLADTVKGTYAGRLMNGTEIVQDAYIVTINKLTDTTVEVQAGFFGDESINFNLSKDGNQISFTNALLSGFSMVYVEGTLMINYSNSYYGMLTYTGVR